MPGSWIVSKRSPTTHDLPQLKEFCPDGRPYRRDSGANHNKEALLAYLQVTALQSRQGARLHLIADGSFVRLRCESVVVGRRSKCQCHFCKNLLRVITPYGVMFAVDRLSDVLTAISHPTRRAIIGQLANGPARFLDIAKPYDTALNSVTKHLKMLERAGLIERKKQGREVLISFRGEPLREVAGWVHEYERFWNERLDQFEQYYRDKRKKEKK